MRARQVIVHTLGDRVPAHLRSAGQDLTRDLLKGTQEFDTDQSLWPVNQAIPKLEAQIQTSGQSHGGHGEAQGVRQHTRTHAFICTQHHKLLAFGCISNFLSNFKYMNTLKKLSHKAI